MMHASNPHSVARQSYDAITISLHWLTALLVIFLFASAEIWGFLPRGGDMRHVLQFLHISFGILLLPVLLFRILWRAAHRGQLPPAMSGLQEQLARAVHLLLYVLLAAQLTLGFLFRWAQGEEFSFFGLFTIPRLIGIDSSWRHTVGGLHENVAWVIIVLAAGHAAAALIHHYILKDRVLARMVPQAADEA